MTEAPVSTQQTMVPIDQVRAMFRRIVTDGAYLKNVNGGWLFNERVPFTGLNLHASYASEEQAIDTLIGIYFPNALRAAA